MPVSQVEIIAFQWDCLTEPERTIATTMANNVVLGTASVDADSADALWEDERGPAWQWYRDAFLSNWKVYETTVTILGVEIRLYASIAAWPIGVLLCINEGDCPGDPDLCRQRTGFP